MYYIDMSFFREQYEKKEARRKQKEMKQKMELEGDDDNSDEDITSRPTRSSRGKDSSQDIEKNKRKKALNSLRRHREEGTGLSRLEGNDDDSYDEEDDRSLLSRYSTKRTSKRVEDSSGNGRAVQEDTYNHDVEEDSDDEDSPPVNFDQARHYLQRKRDWFIEHFFCPYFSEAVIGNYVRISIGMYDGKQVYRFCKVLNVSTGKKEYRFANAITKINLMVEVGKGRKMFNLGIISNSRITQVRII